MPAVQTAFGPLVEPGWPDLKGPDLGAKFLSGAYIMGNINAKRQELENKIAALSLKSMSDEADNARKDGMYQLAVERLQSSNQFKDQEIQLRTQAGEARDARVQLAFDKFDQRNAGNKALFDAANNVLTTIPKDDERFPNAFVQAVTNNARDADPAMYRTLIKTNIDDYNLNANRQNTALVHQEKMLLDKIGSRLYGDPTLHLTDPIEHPELYPEEMTGGGSTWSNIKKWATGQSYGEDEGPPHKSGIRTGSITLPSSGETKEVKFKTTDLTELTKQWKALQAAKDKRLPTVDMPEYGVYAKPANNTAERVQRILDDPDSPPDKRQAAQAWRDAHTDQF